MTEDPRLSRPSSISSLKPTNSGAPRLSAPHSDCPDSMRKLLFCGKELLARSVPPWMRMLQTWEKQVLSARGFKRVGRHSEYTNGMEVRK